MKSSAKCEKCDAYFIIHSSILHGVHTLYGCESSYCVCRKCHNEWYDDGYYEIWRTFIDSHNRELANKLVLDFLGKLG